MRISIVLLLLSVLPGTAVSQDCNSECTTKAAVARANSFDPRLETRAMELRTALGEAQKRTASCTPGDSNVIHALEGEIFQLKETATLLETLETELAATKAAIASAVEAEEDARRRRLPEVARYKESKDDIVKILLEKQLETTELAQQIVDEITKPAPYVNVDKIKKDLQTAFEHYFMGNYDAQEQDVKK